MAESPTEAAPAGAPDQKESVAEPPVSGGGPVVMRDRYTIDTSQPIPELSSPSGTAYAAFDRRNANRALFALICTSGLPPRMRAAAALRGKELRNVIQLVEYEPIDWPPMGQRCMAFIYERPLGGRLVDVLKSSGKPLSEHNIQSLVIEPMANALQDLTDYDVPHRAIRANNLFFMDTGRRVLALGDCLVSPPGFDQPLAYETIVRSMTAPAGRGLGDTTDDLYALGATLAFLLQKESPIGSLAEDDLIYSKVERGSYATLCGSGRIPLALLEPLRGLLSDIADERWGIRELTLWIDGRRMTPMQKRAAPRPESRFTFAGHHHMTPRTLAYAFSRDVPEAARVLREGQVDPWLRRSLSLPDMAAAVGRVVETAGFHANESRGSDDMLVSHVCMLLDPAAPIRYKGFSFMPEAFGPALAHEILRRGNAKISAEILDRDIAGMWFSHRTGGGSLLVALQRQYDRMRGHYQRRGSGYGIERCLYELNPTLPCQSSLVVADYVVEVQDLLPALDTAANREDTKLSPVDRHIAAFIAARSDQDVEPHLKALGDDAPAKTVEGMLSLLALLQWKHGPQAVYGLSSWIGGLLGPAINAYHSRTVRKDIEHEIPRLVRQGSLPELFDLINNAEQRLQDERGFEAAIDEFVQAENEIQEIEGSDTARAETAERIGQQAAAMTSVLVALVFISIMFLSDIW